MDVKKEGDVTTALGILGDSLTKNEWERLFTDWKEGRKDIKMVNGVPYVTSKTPPYQSGDLPQLEG